MPSGLCVVPPVEDGTKAPRADHLTRRQLVDLVGETHAAAILRDRPAVTTWKHWQYVRPTPERLRAWYDGGCSGVGLVTGRISRKLEVLEFAAAAVPDAFRARAAAVGLGDLVARIEAGYSEATPGGGVHWAYHCAAIGENTKLARRPGPPDAQGRPTVEVLIETRGEGGYIVIAPSNGRVHPSEKPYHLLRGAVETIATISPEEREALFDLARTFDTMPKGPVVEPTPSRGKWIVRPGDDFTAQTTWGEVLEPAGWALVFERGGETYWRRPGKDHGVSATTNSNGSDLLCVFTTSTEFEAERGYGKFAAYAVLSHGGDFARAAADLAAKGYGTAGAEHEEPWEPPAPFFHADLPPFPVDALPDWLRSYVAALAEATQTPPDLPALLALAALAAACTRKIEVAVRPGWREPVNLFTVVDLPPGNPKTAVEAAVTEPLVAYEAEEAVRLGPEIAHQTEERKLKEARLQHLRAQAAKAPSEARVAKTKPEAEAAPAKPTRGSLEAEAKALAVELADLVVPEFPRVFCDDVTPERLATLLTLHNGRMAVFSAEGDLFDLMAARYGNAPNFGVFLRGHAGDELRVDRVGRPPEIVHRPAVTLGLAVQPDVIAGLAATRSLRGRGLLGRFLYPIPRNPLGRRTIDAPPVPEETEATNGARVRALLGLPFGTDGFGEPAAHTLQLDVGARRALDAFAQWIEPQLGELREIAGMTDWGGKLVGAVARVAALLHLAEHAPKPAPWEATVSAETIAHAIRIGKYLIPHARAAFTETGAEEKVGDARYLLRWMQKAGADRFSKRDAHRGTQGRFKVVTDLDPALKLLEDHGFIRACLPSDGHDGAGRKPSPSYAVNPLALADSVNSLIDASTFAGIYVGDNWVAPNQDGPWTFRQDAVSAASQYAGHAALVSIVGTTDSSYWSEWLVADVGLTFTC